MMLKLKMKETPSTKIIGGYQISSAWQFLTAFSGNAECDSDADQELI